MLTLYNFFERFESMHNVYEWYFLFIKKLMFKWTVAIYKRHMHATIILIQSDSGSKPSLEFKL